MKVDRRGERESNISILIREGGREASVCCSSKQVTKGVCIETTLLFRISRTHMLHFNLDVAMDE